MRPEPGPGSGTEPRMIRRGISPGRNRETVVRRPRAAVGAVDDLRDAATAEILARPLCFHETAIWILRAVVTG